MGKFIVSLALIFLASRAYGESDGETRFVDRNECVISQIVNEILSIPYDKSGEQNRFLILYPTGESGLYAQCAFFERDASVHCEIKSPFYLNAGERVARLAPLKALGFDLDGAKGNYTREFKVDAEGSPPLAEFMLRSLYGAFLDNPLARLSFYAPLVKTSPSPRACKPSS